jgi:hypothetical protein
MRAAWSSFAAAFLAVGGFVGCLHNEFTGNLTPVPPVHRLPSEYGAPAILIDKDPIIETRDPNHIARANEQRVPQQYRQALSEALALGGFRVTAKADEPHALVARLAIAVTEEGEYVRQVYRCGLYQPDGTTEVAQIDWTWPKGTFVDTFEVFEFATHNVATEVVISRPVLTYLRTRPLAK